MEHKYIVAIHSKYNPCKQFKVFALTMEKALISALEDECYRGEIVDPIRGKDYYAALSILAKSRVFVNVYLDEVGV